jgi:6-pyruvoyltetrahydropterin/6-carboxytetrahydropterin synthase
MYTLMVQRDFIAQHFLTVPNCGPENEWHSHHFALEVLLEGPALNEHGYLVDIVDVKDAISAIVDRYEDATMNDLPEFENRNPSIEHFSRIVCHSFQDRIDTSNLSRITIKIWEDDEAWASYQTDIS